MNLPTLQPQHSNLEIYPKNAAFMAFTGLHETRMLGYTQMHQDGATAVMLGAFNGLCTLRHVAGVTQEALRLMEKAGVSVNEEIHSYETKKEAETIADQFVEKGKQLFWPYPTPKGRYPDKNQVISPALFEQLNCKALLHQLAPSENLPLRTIVGIDDLQNYQFKEPVFLKSGGNAATGWGFAVRPCFNSDDLSQAIQWYLNHREDVPVVIIEEYIPLIACWCVGIAVTETSTVCLGGAEQLFASPSTQIGSIIDPEMPFPDHGTELAIHVGETARQLGFRGIAGMDIGLSEDGRLILFDPNFRINSSTYQLLFHDSLVQRSGFPVSRSFQVSSERPFSELLVKVEMAIDSQRFIPSRLFNGEMHPQSEGNNIVTGLLLGENRADVESINQKLSQDLLP